MEFDKNRFLRNINKQLGFNFKPSQFTNNGNTFMLRVEKYKIHNSKRLLVFLEALKYKNVKTIDSFFDNHIMYICFDV